MHSLSIIMSFQDWGDGKWWNLELNCIFARIMTFHIAKQQVWIISRDHECDAVRNVPWPDFFLPSAWSSENPFLRVIHAVNCFLQPLRKVVRSSSYNLSNRTFKTKQHNYPLYVESKNNDTNERIYTAETDWLEKFTVLSGEGTVRESGMDMDILLYFTWRTSKDLLSSTGNSAQSSVITLWSPGGRMGKG